MRADTASDGSAAACEKQGLGVAVGEQSPSSVPSAPVRSDRSLAHRYFGPLSTGSERASVLSLAATAFGSALLVTPSVFSGLGILLGLAVLLFTSFATLMSLRLLANGAYTTGHTTYGGVVAGSLGRKASLLVDAILSIYGFFVACGGFIFLKQLIHALLLAIGLPGWMVSALRPNRLVVLEALLVAPLCLTKTVAALRYAALLGVTSLFVAVLALCAETPAKHRELVNNLALSAHGAESQLPGDFWLWPAVGTNWVAAVPLNMAICAVAVTCHMSFFATQHELVFPVARRVYKVVTRAMVLVATTYALVGILGFLSLGPPCAEEVPTQAWPSCTPRNVLASPRFRDPVGTLAQAAMVIVALVAIIFNLGAGRCALLSLLGCGPSPVAASRAPSDLSTADGDDGAAYLSPTSEQAQEPSARQTKWHAPVTLMLLVAAAGVGAAFDSIEAIMAVLGGLCVSTFGFAIPLAITVALRPEIATRWPDARIGNWLGITRTGTVVAGLVMALSCVVCYASVVQALANVLR